MAYNQQINHDANQHNYIVEGGTFVINLNKSNIPGNPSTITGRSVAKMQIPIDTLVESWSFVAYIDNPDNPGVNDIIPTSAVKVMVRDTLSQEFWIFTAGGALAQGTPIPANLLFGRFPTQLAAPRRLVQNTILEFTIEPVGVTILDFRFTLLGRRVDMMTPSERDEISGDQRTMGAYWVFFDPLVLTRSDSAANPLRAGPETEENLRIPNIPFDILITAWSGFVTPATPLDASPIARAWYDFQLIDLNNRKYLSDGFEPSTILGGATMASSIVPPAAALPADTEQVVDYVPRTTPLNNAQILRSQSGWQLRARAVYSPLDVALFPTITAQLLLHGMRIPSSEVSTGFPYYNRNDGSLRCPPGSDGIPPGYPLAGPCPPYYPGYQNNGYALGGGNPALGGYPGFTPQMPPAVPGRGVYVNNMPGAWPAAMPYPPVALNTHQPYPVRNPNQEGGQVRLPNQATPDQPASGWGIPGNPNDNRGPRFRNEGQ